MELHLEFSCGILEDMLIWSCKKEADGGKPGGKVWRFKGVATVEGEMAAEAEFTAMMDLQGK